VSYYTILIVFLSVKLFPSSVKYLSKSSWLLCIKDIRNFYSLLDNILEQVNILYFTTFSAAVPAIKMALKVL